VVDPLAASRAARGTVLWLGGVALAFSRGWLVAPAAAALLVAFAGAFPRRPSRTLGAVSGALAVQVVLRWPSLGFQGLTALVAVGAVLPCLVAGFLQLSPRVRRWLGRGAMAAMTVGVILAVPAGVAALLARTDVSRGTAETQGALGSVSNGGTTSGRLQLQQARDDFAAAASRTDSWWTVGARLVPVVAQQRQALAQASAVARDVTAIADQEAAGINLAALRYAGGRIDLNRLRQLMGPLGVVDSSLGRAVHQLAPLNSPWLVSPIRSRLRLLDGDVNKAHTSAALADQVVRAAPALLGGQGVRHYFVAFMTPAESRGLDGLIAAYGELTVNQGRITLSRSGDIGLLNARLPAGRGHLTGPADYLARYGGFHPEQFFQDLSYSPDLPTVADVIAQLYSQAGGDHIDGVLALDPDALAAFLGLTGPVDVPGLGQLTAANAAAVLLKGQYAIFTPGQQTLRHDYLQSALTLEFRKLSAGSLPGPRTLADALDPVVRQGRLLMWSNHPADQPVLRRVGLAGAFPDSDGHDLLAVTTQNAANNKLDAYLQRSITDDVTYDPASGQVKAHVTVLLHNEAPSTGLSSEVLGSYAGSNLSLGTSQTWLTVYSPLGLSAAVDGNKGLSVTTLPELGVTAYSAYVNVAPGATATITVDLQGRVRPGRAYQLTLHTQPIVLADRDLVRLGAGGGWAVEGPATWVPAGFSTEVRTFRLRPRG
jgi:hypothetical protein